MKFRRIPLFALLLTSVALVACGDDDDDLTGPAALEGTFVAQSIDGETLPITETFTEGDVTCTETFNSLTITFKSGGTLSGQAAGSFGCGGQTEPWTESLAGTFTVEGNKLTIDFGEGDIETFTFVRSGSTLTLTDTTDSEVIVFKKQ